MSNRLLARGTLVNLIASVTKVGLQLISVPLMARLVGPADYGLFSLAMPVVTFFLLLAEGGFGISLAREREEDRDVWSTATLFLFGLGVALGIVLIVWSYIQAPLANQPSLPPIMMALSICPVLLAVTVPPIARLTRQARLAVGSIIDLIAVLMGTGLAVAVALTGGGVWSLVAQPVTYWTCKAVLLNIAAPSLPQLRFIPKHLRPHLKVGGLILGGKFLDTGERAAETSIISRFLGAEILGAFTFANQLPRFLTETLGNSLWGTLYAYTLRSENPASLTRTYYLTLRAFSLAIFPGVTLIAVMVKPLLDGLLGPRWDAAAPLLHILLITHAFNSLGGIGAAILFAKGLPRIPFRISVEGIALRLLVVVVGTWLGLFWMAVGLGAIDIFLGLRGIFSLKAVMDYSVRTAASAAAAPVILSAAAGLCCWGLAQSALLDAYFPTLVTVIIYMMISFAVYLLLLVLFERRKLVEEFMMVYRLIRS
jgi:O-antigen/teichoic acid export membrane protein